MIPRGLRKMSGLNSKNHLVVHARGGSFSISTLTSPSSSLSTPSTSMSTPTPTSIRSSTPFCDEDLPRKDQLQKKFDDRNISLLEIAEFVLDYYDQLDDNKKLDAIENIGNRLVTLGYITEGFLDIDTAELLTRFKKVISKGFEDLVDLIYAIKNVYIAPRNKHKGFLIELKDINSLIPASPTPPTTSTPLMDMSLFSLSPVLSKLTGSLIEAARQGKYDLGDDEDLDEPSISMNQWDVRRQVYL